MDVGTYGEEKAAVYLRKQGYEVLCRNFRCRRGEIDLIVRDPALSRCIILIEIKTRRSLSFGMPCEAVTAQKQRRIRRTAEAYALMHSISDWDFRFDVVELLIRQGKTYLRHTQNAF